MSVFRSPFQPAVRRHVLRSPFALRLPGAAGAVVGPLVSGLGSYEGDTQNTAFATYLGRPTDYRVVFFASSNWASFASSTGSITAAFTGKRCVWSVPVACSLDSLAAVAAGTYDSYFNNCADALIPAAIAGEPIVVRLGWEFNIANNNRATTSGGADDSTNWKAAFRRIVGLFRAKSPRFRFDWCPNFGVQLIAPDLCYPGDDVVDIIGMDAYFTVQYDSISDGGVAVFNFRRDQSFGLQWHSDFAAAHGKPMAFSEWGINSNAAGPYTSLFIDWIRTHNILYHNYWEGQHDTASCRLTNGDNPAIAAIYKDAFGLPRITSANTLTGEVGTTMTLPLTAAKPVTWSIVGGADAGLFSLSGSTLTLPTPGSAAVRAVTVRATDSAGYFTDQAITFDVQAVYTFTNTEASAYVARMTVAPPRTLKTALDNLTTVFKANGYATAKAIYIRAVHDSQAALLEFKGGTSSTLVNAPTFTPYRGFTGQYDNTTPRSLQIGLATNAASPFVRDSATLMVWETAELSDNSPAVGVGTTSILLNPRNGSGNASMSLNEYSPLSAAVTTSVGVTTGIRSSSTARRLRRNGATIASDATASSQAPTGEAFLEDCSNPSFPAGHRVGFIWIGSALTDTQESNIVSGLQTYAAAVGAPI